MSDSTVLDSISKNLIAMFKISVTDLHVGCTSSMSSSSSVLTVYVYVVRDKEMYYVIKFVSDLRQVGGFL